MTLKLDPENQNALWCLLQTHRFTGRDQQALAAARQLTTLIEVTALARIVDLRSFWNWHLDWLARNPEFATPSTVGLDHLALGETEQAMALFEKALEGHSSCVLTLAPDPQLDPLRRDPRFVDLMARLGRPGQDGSEPAVY